MFRKQKTDHETQNQANYHLKAKDHDSLNLDSTLYLAYRDISMLLDRHVYNKLPGNKIRILDFGCGVGLSTEIVLNRVAMHSQLHVEMVGVDINEQNLEIARMKLPSVQFRCITTDDKLNDLGKFDLIMCNFVLVEMQASKMLDALSLLKNKLSKNGVIIVTNPTSKAYRPENQWHTFNNQFPENTPTRQSDNSPKLKYHEDQPIKVQVFAAKGSDKSFTFFDYFHSGSAYRSAYQSAGLQLIETHKPIGNAHDQIEWKSEMTKPPYRIHVLGS